MVPFAFVDTIDQQYQIVAQINGTIVKRDEEQYTLNAGEYIFLREVEPTILTSNAPIQFVQLGEVTAYTYFVANNLF